MRPHRLTQQGRGPWPGLCFRLRWKWAQHSRRDKTGFWVGVRTHGLAPSPTSPPPALHRRHYSAGSFSKIHVPLHVSSGTWPYHNPNALSWTQKSSVSRHASMYTGTCMPTCVSTHRYRCVCEDTYRYVYLWVHVHTCIDTCVHVCVHIYMHTHTEPRTLQPAKPGTASPVRETGSRPTSTGQLSDPLSHTKTVVWIFLSLLSKPGEHLAFP